MRDETGRVLIDGFYDDVTPVSETARGYIEAGAFDEASLLSEPGIARTEWGPGARYGEAVMMPALNILGLDAGTVGPGTRNAVPDRASAAIGFRVVPGMSLDRLRERVMAHIADQGYVLLDREPTDAERLEHTHIAEVHWSSAGYEAASTDASHPLIGHLIGLVDDASERPVRVVPLLGGSLPLAPIQDVTGTPFAIVPIVNPDNSQHAPNENMRIGNLWDGIELYAEILADDWQDD